jgi:hypothetical protein
MANNPIPALTFTLVPEGDNVSLDAMLNALKSVRTLAQDVDLAVTRRTRGRRWVVTDLHSSAPTITIRPATEDEGVVAFIGHGLRELTIEAPTAPPANFTEDALMDVRGLSRLFTGPQRLDRILFSINGDAVAEVTETIAQTVDHVLRSGYETYTSLEGNLEAINIHGRQSFTIWERSTGLPVQCEMPKGDPHWRERVRNLLGNRVMVTGRVKYFGNGIPRRVKELEDIRDMTPDESLPKAEFGSIPDITGGQESVAYLRVVRGE